MLFAIAAGTTAHAQQANPASANAYGVIDRLPPVPAYAQLGIDPIGANDNSLSPVAPDGSIRLAQSSQFANQTVTPQTTQPLTASPPAGNERSLFQGLDLTADWVPRLENDSIGRSTMSAAIKLGIPPQLIGSPILVTPRAGIHLVDGPTPLDVPARLYDLELGFRTFRKINERWMANIGVNVGVYGDDYSLDSSEALRVSGTAVAIYNASPEWQWAIGVAYLNRDDISVVPAFGVIHDRGWVRYELMLPRPRVIWRLPDGPNCQERTFYLAGDMGGGAWAVERAGGGTDTLNLSRYGLLLGWEQKHEGGWSRRFEFGYVFARDLEYGTGGEELSLDDSLIARVGLSY